MSKDFDPRRFLQKAPNAMLRRYLDARGYLPDFDWQVLTETRIEALYQAISALPSGVMDGVIADFKDIDVLATEGGKLAVLDVADAVGVGGLVAEQLEALGDFHECSFWTFLEHKDIWPIAVRIADADNKPRRYWRRRNNMPGLATTVSDAIGKQLGESLSNLLFRKQARGQRCHVEHYSRGARDYFFAYPQDHRQSDLELLDGEFKKRLRLPTFEIVFVFDKVSRTLRTWWRGNSKLVPDLEVAFARSVLGSEIERVKPKDTRVYDLSPLLDRGFQFRREVSFGVADVLVCGLKVRVLGEEEATFEFNVGPKASRYAVYDHLKRAIDSIPRSKIRLLQVGIRVIFSEGVDGREVRPRKFEISWPNSCSLQNEGRDLVIQQMLSLSGIEPRTSPDVDADDVEPS
jgi:hypothetical protein